MTHAVVRTNHKGEKFVGKCVKCGEDGLGMGAAFKPCPEDANFSDSEALGIILRGDTKEDQIDAIGAGKKA